MTLETAKLIKSIPQGQEKERCKEAEAVLRGGMNICETANDGSRQYVWIKVKPTKTDNESSIAAAMKTYRGRKNPSPVLSEKKQQTPRQVPVPQPQAIVTEEEEDTKGRDAFSLLFIYLKTKFYQFVKVMDTLVEE